MITVIARVTKSGALTKKNGDIVTNKDGETIHGLELGGGKGLFTFPDKGIIEFLPPVGQRVKASVIREYWKNDKGDYSDRMVCTDWEPA